MSFRFGHYIPGDAALVAWDAGPLGPPPEIIISAGDDGTVTDGSLGFVPVELAPPGTFASWLPPGVVADGFVVPGALADGFTVELSGLVGAIVAEVWLSEFVTPPGPADVVASGTSGALPGPLLSVGFNADVGPPGLNASVVAEVLLPGPIPGPLLIPGHNGADVSGSDSAADPDSTMDSDSPSLVDSDSPSAVDSDSPSPEASAVSVAEVSSVLPVSLSFFVSAGAAAVVVGFGIYP